MRKRHILSLVAIMLLLPLPTFLWGNSAHATPRVDIYLTSWCPYCEQAVRFFHERNIPVRIFNIEDDQEAAERKRHLDPRKGVPLVVINGQVVYGFSSRAYDTALDD
jgi:glutaredoxin